MRKLVSRGVNIMSDERDRMLEVIWRETKPEIIKPIDETTPKRYDTSAIYDNPSEYMTTRGIFRYAGVEVIR